MFGLQSSFVQIAIGSASQPLRANRPCAPGRRRRRPLARGPLHSAFDAAPSRPQASGRVFDVQTRTHWVRRLRDCGSRMHILCQVPREMVAIAYHEGGRFVLALASNVRHSCSVRRWCYEHLWRAQMLAMQLTVRAASCSPFMAFEKAARCGANAHD